MEKQILQTLCYADIFESPLSSNELVNYLFGPKKQSKEEIELAIKNLPVIKKNSYFALEGRERLFKEKTKRLKFSRQKMKKALSVASILSYIPSIRYIGISGSLAVDNAKREDDIDYFIVTSDKLVWITRFITNCALLVMGVKRSRKEKFGTDKICPNMFISNSSLAFPKNFQSYYIAREIVQVKTLVDKDNLRSKILSENSWILRFLPNFEIPKKKKLVGKNILRKLTFSAIDFPFYISQKFYMRKHKTREFISMNIVQFHPADRGKYIKDLFSIRYKSISSYSENQYITTPRKASQFVLN